MKLSADVLTLFLKLIGKCLNLVFSYFIRQSQRGKGFATEAAHAMALLAFKILKARKVEIYCDAENS